MVGKANQNLLFSYLIIDCKVESFRSLKLSSLQSNRPRVLLINSAEKETKNLILTLDDEKLDFLKLDSATALLTRP